MSLFEAKYYTDDQIWELLSDLSQEREEIQKLLAKPEVSTDPDKFVDLARRLTRLEEIHSLLDELKELLQARQQVQIWLKEEEGDISQLETLWEEYRGESKEAARALYDTLLQQGYLQKETEDETDLAILHYFEAMGPEYPWRLGVNLNMEEVEARRRLEILMEKGLIERVEGTMLDNYHRQKGWTKHMNHTYYRLSRQGELYLRQS